MWRLVSNWKLVAQFLKSIFRWHFPTPHEWFPLVWWCRRKQEIRLCKSLRKSLKSKRRTLHLRWGTSLYHPGYKASSPALLFHAWQVHKNGFGLMNGPPKASMESPGRWEMITQIREHISPLMGLWGHLAVEGTVSASAYVLFIGLCKGQKEKEASLVCVISADLTIWHSLVPCLWFTLPF